jgi:tRNA threonylcarbamoyladenosine biosynthesis protein TsaE
VEVHEFHVRTSAPAETRRVAAQVARHLRPGGVVSLSGELGAGKTCFVQGVATELGVEVPVTSPTFVLVKHYAGRLPLVHCDVYRLDRLSDLLELGDEVLAPDVVTLVEWGDAVAALLPTDRVEVDLRSASDDPADPAPDRAVTVRLRGAATDRAQALAAELGVGDRAADRC